MIGIPAEWAYARGQELDAEGRFAEAGPLMDRAVGWSLTGALWRSGRVRIKEWRRLSAADQNGTRGAELLQVSAARFLRGRSASPGSPWFTAALADVYKRREIFARQFRVVSLDRLTLGPWALLGDDGRIAIGLLRAAIEREPTNFENYDQLLYLLEQVGLRDEALRTMEASARALPDFGAHPDFVFEEFDRDLVEAFWRAARATAPADVPFVAPDRKLLASGLLSRRLGHLAEAEQDLRAAMNEPTTKLSYAEAAFHLGLVLVDLERFDEAESFLALALREPVFGPGVAGTRARVAAMRERWPEALAQLREARRLSPRELWVLLEFARAAQKAEVWDQAEEALRWAVLVHPQSPAPRVAMVELFLARGDGAKARGALNEFVAAFGRTQDAVRLEAALAAPLDPDRQ